MTRRASAPAAPRSHGAPRVISPRNKVNVALPFSRLTVQEPMKMTAGDWISLTGLVISVVGFGVVIWRSATPRSATPRSATLRSAMPRPDRVAVGRP